MSGVYLIEGRYHFVGDDGTRLDIDARPPAGYTPEPTYPTGYALLPCRICRTPLSLTLARRGAHIGCLPDEQAYGLLRICGGVFTTLIPVYHGERLHQKEPHELRSTRPTLARGGAAA